MKKIILYLIAFFSIVNISGQVVQLNCSHLIVENIEMDNDTANLMKVTLKYNCPNCPNGINTCVYHNLDVIRIVAPFDTIASTNGCHCLISPTNNNTRTYDVYSTVSTLPLISNLKVSFYNRTCGCENIPFSKTLITNLENFEYLIFPNPTSNDLTIKSIGNTINYIKIVDALGRLVFSKYNTVSAPIINIANFASGMYLLTIYDKSNMRIKTFKIIKK